MTFNKIKILISKNLFNEQTLWKNVQGIMLILIVLIFTKTTTDMLVTCYVDDNDFLGIEVTDFIMLNNIHIIFIILEILEFQLLVN